MEMDNPGELLDFVDEHDQVTGTILRRDALGPNLAHIRVVHALVVNRQGELWIPTRAAHKKLFPGGLDFSIGGHVGSGQTYDQAITAETQEELGLDLGTLDWREVAYLTPADGVVAFAKVYAISAENVDHYNAQDYSSGRWYTLQDLLAHLATGVVHKDDLPLVVRRYFS
jgi:isopentenyldiphosphate isomerase